MTAGFVCGNLCTSTICIEPTHVRVCAGLPRLIEVVLSRQGLRNEQMLVAPPGRVLVPF